MILVSLCAETIKPVSEGDKIWQLWREMYPFIKWILNYYIDLLTVALWWWHTRYSIRYWDFFFCSFFFMFFSGGWGKTKLFVAHHTCMYFHTRRVSIKLNRLCNQALAGVSFGSNDLWNLSETGDRFSTQLAKMSIDPRSSNSQLTSLQYFPPVQVYQTAAMTHDKRKEKNKEKRRKGKTWNV